jgi:hypothetical protein
MGQAVVVKSNTQYVRNILKLYRSTPAETVKVGTDWYSRARSIAAELTPNDVRIGAGIIAATSPLTPWKRNVELARKCVAEGGLNGGTLGNSLRAANRILNGEDPLDVLKGDKVRAFYAAIVGDGSIVTIDRHAYAIAANKPFTKDVSIGKNLYREMNASYIRAAEIAKIDVHALQAITWIEYRSRKGILD